MNSHSVALPMPLHLLISRTLVLCKTLLQHSHFLPLAATHKNNISEGLYYHHFGASIAPHLLWESFKSATMDNNQHAPDFLVLAYLTAITTCEGKQIQAIEIKAVDQQKREHVFTHPYFTVRGKLVVSPPLSQID